MNKNKVVLNVGGKRFETLEATMRRIPNSLLGRIDMSSPYYDVANSEFFFDRDPFLFTSVLNLYRIGELHLPHNICGPAIKRELLFWEVDENIISECCWRFYKAFEEEQGRLVRIRHAFGFNKSEYSPTMYHRRGDGSKGARYWTQVTWQLLSDPTSSLGAKIWAVTFFLLLLLSCTVQILRTEPALRSTKYDNATDRILRLYSGSEAESTAAYVLRVLEDILTVFFTLELTMRFAVCPDKKKFFRDALNWVDLICVIPMLMIFIVRIIINAQNSNEALTYVSAYMSITGLLRVLRLLKLIQHVIGFKILILTLKASMKEILLLMGLIALGTVLFAVSVYIAEIFDEETKFMSISSGLWWAIITMTTVGYGDLSPKTFAGRVIGTLCAMSGILATGLAIPVIASNFDKFYSDAQVLKQARLTEGRPKHAEMRKRAKDPFVIAEARVAAANGRGANRAETAPSPIAITAGQTSVSGGDVGQEHEVVVSVIAAADDSVVIANEALEEQLEMQPEVAAEVEMSSVSLPRQNGVVASNLNSTPKRRFSLGSFHNNSVAPAQSTDPPTASPIHKSRSSFLTINSESVARETVT